MNVTLNLKPEIEKGLKARAQARGVSPDDYLQELVAKEAGVPVATEQRPIQKRFDNLSDLLLNSPFAGPISIWSDPKTIRARLMLHERLPDRYECSVRVQSAGRPRCGR